MNDMILPSLPSTLHWQNEPATWQLSPEQQITITASAKTDWFVDPQGTGNVSNAPALLFPVSHPCLLSAQVTVNPASTFDAGALVVYETSSSWGKLALELSPQGQLTVVSVVTKGMSDDCNAFSAASPAYLRLSRLQQAYAFHFSQDGKSWSLIRYFRLLEEASANLGFLAQSPTGNGCTVRFSEIRYESRLLADIRSGE